MSLFFSNDNPAIVTRASSCVHKDTRKPIKAGWRLSTSSPFTCADHAPRATLNVKAAGRLAAMRRGSGRIRLRRLSIESKAYGRGLAKGADRTREVFSETESEYWGQIRPRIG
jgi:hypothetical protein